MKARVVTHWGEIIQLNYGRALVGGSGAEGQVQIFGTNGPTGFSDVEPHGEGPAVIVGRKGAYRGVQMSRGAFYVIDTAYYVTLKAPLDVKWVYYALLAEDIQGLGSGSAIPSTRREDVYSLPLSLPPRCEQVAIREVLSAFDDKIAANHRIVVAADQIIRVQVAARLAVPKKLWGALSVVFGEAFKGDSFSAPGIGRALVRIRDLKSQKCQVWTTEQRAKEFEVRPGDLLVGMDAEFRATRWSGPNGVLNQRVLTASSEKYGPAIAREMLVEPLRRIERSKSGTTVIHLNKSDLLAEEILAPVDSEVPALRALVDPMWNRAVAAEKESVRLAAIRDELLPLLMSGKITVKDAEKTVEEVV